MNNLLNYRFVTSNGEVSYTYDDYDKMLEEALDLACERCKCTGGLIISNKLKKHDDYIKLQKGVDLPFEGLQWEDFRYILIVDFFY